MTPPIALTIAGSDPSGGAGIQADLTTFAAHGVHGTSVVTALTAQNTTGVQGVHVAPAEFVEAQLQSVLTDLTIDAVKTGMLATEEIVWLVGRHANAGALPNLVVDPVMVASTGSRLLSEEAELAYVTELLPAATVITPNLREASVLIGTQLDRAADVVEHARQLQSLCPTGWVVVTGGHVTDDEAIDVVIHDGEVTQLPSKWIETENDHGTGCTFASATAARLARGDDPRTAITGAKAFVAEQIERSASWQIGHGRGPVAHIVS